MKKILLTGIGLIIIIVLGVYLGAHRSIAPSSIDSATTTDATATDTSDSTSHPGGTVTVPEVGEVTLGLNESASFRGVLITPVSVEEDSRCPAGVYCIQAGTVRVKLDITSTLGSVSKIVKLGDTVTVGAKTFTFTKVDPLKTKATIAPADYRFTVKVENAAA